MERVIGGRRFVHRHEPLIGKHRLNHRAGAITARNFEFVFVDLDEQVLYLQIGDDFFTRVEAIEAAIGWRRVVVTIASSVRISINGKPWRWPTA